MPSPTLVYTADLDKDGFSGLYRATTDAPESRVAVLPDNDNVDVEGAWLSPNGSRIAALVDFTAGTDSNFNYSLVTMNLDGSNRHVVDTETSNFSAAPSYFDAVNGVTWTADGNNLVYGWQHIVAPAFTATDTLREAPANGGAVTTLANSSGLTDPSLSPDGTQLAAADASNSTGHVIVAPFSDLTSKTVVDPSLPNGFERTAPVWSPDGSALAYIKDDSDDPSANNPLDASEIDVARVSAGTWGAPVVAYGPVKTASQAWIAENPVWSDNSTIVFDQMDDSSTSAPSAPQHLDSIAFGTSWGAATDITSTDTALLRYPAVAPADVTPPSAVTLTPFTFSANSVTLRWSAPDADYSHVTLHRTDLTAGSSVVDIPNVFGTSYTDKSLTAGHTYEYTATDFDGAGNMGPESTARDVTTLNAPHIVATSPTSGYSATLPFYVRWGVTQPSNTARYTVKYAVKGGSKWALGAAQSWVTDSSVSGSTFHPAGMVAGQTYYFQAVTHDAYGNSSGVTSWTGDNVPLDQRAGIFSRNWRTVSNSAYWLGSIAVTGVNGSSETYSVTSRSIQVIGDMCAACGSFKVYVNSKLVATVSTASRSTKIRRVLWTWNYSTIAKRTVKIVADLTPHHELLIDGMGDLR